MNDREVRNNRIGKAGDHRDGTPEEQMAAEAALELLRYPQLTAGQTLKRSVKRLAGRKLPSVDRFSWPNGLLALGLFRYLETAGALAAGGRKSSEREGAGGQESAEREGAGGQESFKREGAGGAGALGRFFDSWERKGFRARSLEDMLSAHVLLLAYTAADGPEAAVGQTDSLSYAQPFRRDSWKDGIRRAADYLKAYPRTEDGSLPYRADQQNGHVYVDALGMAAPFLVNYGLRFDNGEALAAGLRQFSNFLAYGMQEEQGLPYHGYGGAGGCRHGVPGWGRGTGWLLLGLAEALTAFAHGGGTGALAADAADMAEQAGRAFLRLADTVCRYLREDGTLPWLLPAGQGPADSSGLAMCCYGIALGLREGLLPAGRYETALKAGRNALAGQLRAGKVYGASGECGGFGVYPQRYGAYPWSLGPALGFFSLWPPS